MIRPLLLWALLGALAAPPVRAQSGADSLFDATARQGINDVYNLQFEKADSEFQELVRMKPAHPAGYFFLAMVDWWRIIIDLDNREYDKRFFDRLDGVIDLCDSLLDKNRDDVTAIFFKGGSIGFEGRLQFHRDDYLAAANAGRKALPLVQEASSLDPNNHDILLGSGMYNYYADVIPEEYPFLKPLLLFVPSGDKAKGIAQLNAAAQRGKYASIEATYFLLQIYFFYEKDYQKALDLALKLTSRFPRNMLFQRYLGRCYVALSNWTSARATFADALGKSQRGQRGYTTTVEREAEYYLGLCDMNTRMLDSALVHFYRCDELSRNVDHDGPSGFMVMANLKAGMVYDLEARRDLAVQQYRKVLAMKEYKDSYSQAEQFLRSPYAP